MTLNNGGRDPRLLLDWNVAVVGTLCFGAEVRCDDLVVVGGALEKDNDLAISESLGKVVEPEEWNANAMNE